MSSFTRYTECRLNQAFTDPEVFTPAQEVSHYCDPASSQRFYCGFVWYTWHTQVHDTKCARGGCFKLDGGATHNVLCFGELTKIFAGLDSTMPPKSIVVFRRPSSTALCSGNPRGKEEGGDSPGGKGARDSRKAGSGISDRAGVGRRRHDEGIAECTARNISGEKVKTTGEDLRSEDKAVGGSLGRVGVRGCGRDVEWQKCESISHQNEPFLQNTRNI